MIIVVVSTFLLSFIPLINSENITTYISTEQPAQTAIEDITNHFTTIVDHEYTHPILLSSNLSHINDPEDVFPRGQKVLLNEDIMNGNNSSPSYGITWNKLDSFLKSGTRSFLEMVKISRRSNASEKCKSGFERYFNALSNLETWAVKMEDASGKIAGGVLEGRLMFLGSFDECLKIRVDSVEDNSVEDFRGQFCIVSYTSPLIKSIYLRNGSFNQEYVETYGEPPEWIQDLILRSGEHLKYMSLHLGTCVPSTCSNEDIQLIFTDIASPLGLNIGVKGCQVEEQMVWTKNLIAAVSALSFIAILCSFGTAADIVSRFYGNPSTEVLVEESEKPKNSVMKVLKIFSVPSNIDILMKKNNTNSFGCFDGMRFFSLTLIMLYHNYSLFDVWKYHIYRNFLSFEDDYSSFLFFAVFENAKLGIASFFFMSGFLMSYWLWKKLEEKKEKVNFFKYFLHKYWRLTPALALTLAVFIVFVNMGSGPIWMTVLVPAEERCNSHWWKCFLYLSNWWSTREQCLGHLWYVACLMQLHIIGFILIQLTHRWPVVGVLMGLIVFFGCIAAVVFIMISLNFPLPMLFVIKNHENRAVWTASVYYKPFYNFSPYFIGMVVGFFVLKYKDKQIWRRYQALGWIISIFGSLYAVFGLRILGNDPVNDTFYVVFHLIAWSVSLGWVTYACIAGYGGIINRLLSWNGFHLFSTISYLVYLFHIIVVYYIRGSMKELTNYGNYEMMASFLTVLVVSTFLAFVGHIAVEMPFVHLEKIIF